MIDVVTARELSRRLQLTDCVKSVEWTLPDLGLEAFHAYVIWSRSEPTRALYVGKSIGVVGRIGQHLSKAPWRGDAGDVTVYEFASIAAMEAAEIRLIQALRPSENFQVPEFRDGEFFAWTIRTRVA
jgi:hypothetical protein